MSVKQFLQRAIRSSLAFPRVGFRCTSYLAASRVPISSVRRGKSSSTLLLGELGVAIECPSSSWLLRAYEDAIALKSSGACFEVREDGHIIVDAGDIRVDVSTPDEMFILREIIVDGCYDFYSNDKCVVWDIGMNVGIASLFFAAKNSSDVYAYELSHTTFSRANYNLSLNPDLAARIFSNNMGIGANNGTVHFSINPDRRGCTSNSADTPLHRGFDTEMETATVKSCVEVLDEIAVLAGTRSIVAKIDCEGAEYEIIDALCCAKRIRQLSLIMMEWHSFVSDRSPKQLITQLQNSGFAVFAPTPLSHIAGMIYAVRL